MEFALVHLAHLSEFIVKFLNFGESATVWGCGRCEANIENLLDDVNLGMEPLVLMGLV